jgi:YgiT-type zinc finger domain-containing protein
MICEVCGKKGARVRRTTRACGRGLTAFLIEGVPVVACPHCGESYMTAATLQEIERIRLHWRQLVVNRKVPVAEFRGAA